MEIAQDEDPAEGPCISFQLIKRDESGTPLFKGEKRVREFSMWASIDLKTWTRSAVSVSIGGAVPASIALYPLPPDVIIFAGGCPIKYFLWADDIVLVDSCAHEVVDIIPGAA